MKYLHKQMATGVISVFFLACCNSPTNFSSSIGFSEVTPPVTASDHDIEKIPNLCQFYAFPEKYEGKLVEIDTNLYHVGGVTSIGDERCVTPHALIDVEFTEAIELRFCESKDTTNELCSIIKAAVQENEKPNFTVAAKFIGRFDSYKTKAGFTLRGVRFHFVIENITDIGVATPIKLIRPFTNK